MYILVMQVTQSWAHNLEALFYASIAVILKSDFNG